MIKTVDFFLVFCFLKTGFCSSFSPKWVFCSERFRRSEHSRCSEGSRRSDGSRLCKHVRCICLVIIYIVIKTENVRREPSWSRARKLCKPSHRGKMGLPREGKLKSKNEKLNNWKTFFPSREFLSFFFCTPVGFFLQDFFIFYNKVHVHVRRPFSFEPEGVQGRQAAE